MNKLLIVFGTFIFADGISSLYTYMKGEKARGQAWADHAFRINRCLMGIAIVVIGWLT